MENWNLLIFWGGAIGKMIIVDWKHFRYRGGQFKINKALFSYKMPLDSRVENYLKVMLNPPILPQFLALCNIGNFSMSFGCKISSDSGDSRHHWFSFFLTKTDFFVLSTLKACKYVTQEPIKILEPKLFEKLETLIHAIESKSKILITASSAELSWVSFARLTVRWVSNTLLIFCL